MCNAGDLDFEDIETPNHQGSFQLPIGETTYTVDSLISDLQDPNILITSDNAGLISVAYYDTTVFKDVADIIDLDDVSNPGSVSPGISYIGAPSNITEAFPTIPLTFTYDAANGEELDSVIYSAGTVALNIVSGYTQAITFQLTINDIIEVSSGNPLVFTGSIGRGAFTPTPNPITIPLAGYKTLIDRSGGSNQFSGQFDGSIQILAGDNVSGTTLISYTLDMNNVEFSEIYGYFGQTTVDIQSQSITIDFFDGIDPGGFEFGSPEINFIISNSFGIPMGLNLDQISAANSSSSVILTGTVTESPQNVRGPSISQVGQSLTSSVSVTIDNSNINELLAISPNQFNIDVSAITNFGNTVTKDRNFVLITATDTSQVQVITELNLPLEVKLLNFTRDFGSNIESFDFEEADTITLILTTENRLPLNAIIDMQFLAADSTVLFQYTDVLFMQSGDPTIGRIEEPIRNEAEIKVYQGNGYQELLDGSILNLVMKIDSYAASDNNFVKLYSDADLVLKVAMRGNLNYEL